MQRKGYFHKLKRKIFRFFLWRHFRLHLQGLSPKAALQLEKRAPLSLFFQRNASALGFKTLSASVGAGTNGVE